MSEALLGCPHCGKPVGFASAMAGQVVACPHCRGPFQMPDRPPASPPPVAAQTKRAPGPADSGLDFERDQAPSAIGAKAELDSYRAAVTLATVVALAGAIVVFIVLGLSVYSFVTPMIRGDQRVAGFVWLVASFLFAALAVAGLFLMRAFVLVVVDAARTLRAIERDAAVTRKTK